MEGGEGGKEGGTEGEKREEKINYNLSGLSIASKKTIHNYLKGY